MHQGIHWGSIVIGSLGVRAGGGGDHLPNIDAIVVGDGNAEDSDLESRFSG